MAYQKIEQPKKQYPSYQNKDEKKWSEINGKKEQSFIKLNASNCAAQLLSAMIQAGLAKPDSKEMLMLDYQKLHADIVTFLTNQ